MKDKLSKVHISSVLLKLHLKQYFLLLLATLFLFIFLFVLFDFVHKSSRSFQEYQPPVWTIIRYYIYQIPTLMVQAFPLASLIASVALMVGLNRGNEVTALRSFGLSPLLIGMPVYVGSFIVCLFSFVLGEYIVPFASDRMHYVEDVLIEKNAEDEQSDGVRWLKDPVRLFSYSSFDPQTGYLSELKIYKPSNLFVLDEMVLAKKARHLSGSNWKLEEVFHYEFLINGSVKKLQTIPSLEMSLPFDLKTLRKDRRKPNELSLTQLRSKVKEGINSGLNTVSHQVEYHSKMAFAFAAFFVSLISLRLIFRSERALETVRSVLFAILLGLSYWFLFNIFKNLGKRGTLPPFWSAWAANIFTLLLNVYLIRKMRKNLT